MTPRAPHTTHAARTPHAPRKARRQIERLEPRKLFAVTLSTPLSDVTVPSGAFPTSIDLASRYSSDTVTGPAVRLGVSIGGTPAQNIDVALFNSTPLTRDNFLRYVDSGRYNNTLIHRSVPGFVLQGGGYDTSGTAVTKFGTVNNEFATSPRDGQGRVNTRATLSMAKKGGDPNSADSEFFINLNDNSANLDNQNGGFTTFARVVGSGMSVADTIAALQRTSFNSPFDELPTVNYPANATNSPTNANLVILTSATRLAPVSFSVSSSDTSLVVPTVSAAGVLDLAYVPARSGTATITVVATDLDGASATHTFAVNVAPAATLSISDGNNRLSPAGSPVAYGNVLPSGSTPVARTLSLTNNGSLTLNNLSASFTGDNAFEITSQLPTSLASGQSVNVSVRLKTDVTGPRNSTLTFTSDGSTPQFVVPLTADLRLPVVLGSGGVKSATFTQGSGATATTVTVALSGPGTATLSLAGPGLTASPVRGGNVSVAGAAALDTIVFATTTTASSLTITSRGPALVELNSVATTGTASLNAFNARTTRLNGSLTFGLGNTATAAQLRSLTLAELRTASVSLGSNNDPKASFTLTASVVDETPILVGYPTRSISVSTWNAGTTAPALRTRTLSAITVKSDFNSPVTLNGNLGTANISGGVGSLWDIGGSVSKFSAASASATFTLKTTQSVSSATFRGAFNGSLEVGNQLGTFSAAAGTEPSITANGSANRVSFGGTANSLFMSVGGDIGSFSANQLISSRIYAGLTRLDQGQIFPAAANTNYFNGASLINSFTVRGAGLPSSAPFAFDNSVVVAVNIRSISLATVNTATNVASGVSADNIGSLSFRPPASPPISLRNVTQQSQVPGAFLPTASTVGFDLKIL